MTIWSRRSAVACSRSATLCASCQATDHCRPSAKNVAATPSSPTAVSGGQSFTAIAAGWAHACALTASGAAWCWGHNGSGEIGDGTGSNRGTPTAVSGGLAFSRISAGNAVSFGLLP